MPDRNVTKKLAYASLYNKKDVRHLPSLKSTKTLE